MSKTIKLFWTIISFAPLYLVCSIILMVDGFCREDGHILGYIGVAILIISLLCVVFCKWLLHVAYKKLAPIKIQIVEATSKDSDMLSYVLAYLSPMITLVVSEVNYWAFGGIVIVVIILMLMTKAVFINPLVFLFGYRYYTIKVNSGMSYTLLSKQRRFNPQHVEKIVEIFDEVYLEV